jgi:hypothetical protein
MILFKFPKKTVLCCWTILRKLVCTYDTYIDKEFETKQVVPWYQFQVLGIIMCFVPLSFLIYMYSESSRTPKYRESFVRTL